MKHKFIAATLFLALTAPALADERGSRGERIVDRLDTDGDHLVSLSEFKAPEDNMLKQADLNGDGKVTLEEMQKHRDARMQEREARMQDMMKERESRMDEMFKSMDTDGDGAVTVDEARAAAFHRMDKNGDGFLSADEFRRPHRERGHRFPPPPMDD
jgi:Ca2+-binding EF-hand superfamily protein